MMGVLISAGKKFGQGNTPDYAKAGHFFSTLKTQPGADQALIER